MLIKSKTTQNFSEWRCIKLQRKIKSNSQNQNETKFWKTKGKLSGDSISDKLELGL